MTDIRLEEMTPEQVTAWVEGRRRRMAEAAVRGGMSPAEARQHAEDQIRAAAPTLDRADGNAVYRLLDRETELGSVLARLSDQSEGREVFIWDLTLSGEHRDQGQAAMDAVERHFASLGAGWLRMFVVPSNVDTFADRGYTRVVTTMRRDYPRVSDVDYPDDLPEVHLVRMTKEQFEDYLTFARVENAANTAQAQMLPKTEADSASNAYFDSVSPTAFEDQWQLLMAAMHGDEQVGMVWFELTQGPKGLHASGNDLRVREDLRGKGFGLAVMKAAGELLRSRNVATVSGRVWGFNERLRKMYSEMGMQDGAVQMRKELGSGMI